MKKELDQKMKHLESIKDDNTIYLYVLRDLQNLNKNNKSSTLVKDSEGNVSGFKLTKDQSNRKIFQIHLAPLR